MVAATFLGWTLDAFDFFLLVFVLKDIAAEFKTDITDVTFAILAAGRGGQSGGMSGHAESLCRRARFAVIVLAHVAAEAKPRQP